MRLRLIAELGLARTLLGSFNALGHPGGDRREPLVRRAERAFGLEPHHKCKYSLGTAPLIIYHARIWGRGNGLHLLQSSATSGTSILVALPLHRVLGKGLINHGCELLVRNGTNKRAPVDKERRRSLYP